jgi:3-oxoadipate enol-lactonase
MWLAVGPVDELAEAVASIILGVPDVSGPWIAKWQARDKELIREPGTCLMERDDLVARLSEITCPALVIHGTEDTALSMEEAVVTAAGLSGCSGVVAVPGAHAANLTHPEAVNAAMRSFLDSLPA